VKEYVEVVRTFFPDILFQVHDLFGELHRVGCRWTLTGTQTGEFKGNPPTGRQVEVPETPSSITTIAPRILCSTHAPSERTIEQGTA
jgi:predicted ester cyclase